MNTPPPSGAETAISGRMLVILACAPTEFNEMGSVILKERRYA
jgi:hypothetical protein